MFTITPPLEIKALELANNLRFSPEGRQRTSHTEKMWRYRTYQGGDPAGSIDWKQSARSREILIREHEKIITRDVYFCTLLDLDKPEIQQSVTVLLALAHTLVKKERAVGWASPDRPVTRTSSMITPMFERGLNTQVTGTKTPNIRSQFILYAADFNTISDEVMVALKNYAALGNRGLLLHVGEQDLTQTLPIVKAAHNAQWPIVSMEHQDTNRLDKPLAHLLEKTLQATR